MADPDLDDLIKKECYHRRARQGDKFCPDCGMSMDRETRRKDTAHFWARYEEITGREAPHDCGLD